MAEGDSIIKYKDLIGKDDTFKVISANIKKIEKELLGMVKATDKAFSSLSPNDSAGLDKLEKQVIANEKAKKKLIQTEKAANKVKKATINLTNEQLIQLQKEKLVQRERLARAKQQAIISTEEKNNIASLRAQLSLATLDWKKLTAEEAKNTKEGQRLVANKKSLTKQLKKLEEATDDHRRSVGKYSKSLAGVGKLAARVFVGRSLIDGFRRVGTFFNKLIQDNKEASKSMQELDSAFGAVGNAINKAGVGILNVLAPALKLVANGIVSIINFFSGATVGMFEFSATSEELKGVTEGLNKEFVKESSALNQVFSSLREATEGSKERKDIIDKINDQYGQYLPNLLTEKSSLLEIEAAQRIVNDQLSKNFFLKIQQATQTDVFINKTKSQIKGFKDLQISAKRAGKEIGSDLTGAFRELLEQFNDVEGAGKIANDILTKGFFIYSKTGDELEKLNPSMFELVKVIKELGEGGTVATLAKNTSRYNDVISDSDSAIKSITEGMKTYDRSIKGTTKSVEALAAAETKAASDRLKAIEELQRQLEKAEVDNIEDKNERLIALEDLRFKEEQRIRDNAFVELKELIKKQGGDVVELEGLNDALIIEQEIAHQQKLLDIADGFNNEKKAKIAKIAADAKQEQSAADKFSEQLIKDTQKANIDEEKEISKRRSERLKQEAKDREEAAKSQEERNKQIIKNILDTQQKIGAIINDLFKQQVDLSAKSVSEQEDNVARQQGRAADGLKNSLLFEKKELSKRQDEQRARQRESKLIAKGVALFNLVSAAAASGDKNAVLKAIAQFGVLTAFEGTIGLAQGTEHVEKTLGKSAAVRSGTDGYLGITAKGKQFRFDGTERIVSGSDNALLGGMSNEDLVPNALLGSAMSDYFDRPSILSSNPYKDQQDSFRKAVTSKKEDNRVLDELKGIKAELSAQPNYSAQIVEVQKELHEFVLRENRRNMTKITREILRG